MSSESPRKKGQRVKGGLAVTLFIWFIILSIGPVTFVGFNEYKAGKENIIKNRYEQLASINFQLTQRINDYFETVLTNLFIMAAPSESFIAEVTSSPAFKEQSLAEAVQSEAYERIQSRYAVEYESFLRFYDYSDILVGDAQGNIIYTVNGYEDFGKNLFSSDLSNTQLAQAVRSSLNSLEPKYADLDDYAPVADKVVFLVLPLVDDAQINVGFIAIQINPNNIQSLFEYGESTINGLSSFLVGVDRKIRFGSRVEKVNNYTYPEDNPLMQLWLSNLDENGDFNEEDHQQTHSASSDDHESEWDLEGVLEGDLEGEVDEHASSDEQLKQAADASVNHVRNYVHDEKVLGIFLPLKIAGTPMIILSEVTSRHAFASVFEFRERLLILSAITLILVIFIAFLVTRQLVKPIRLINNWVNRVASGDYVEGTVLKGNNEISELSQSFAQMTEKLRTVSNENARKSWLQEGQAGLHDSVRGEQKMVELCRNIVSYIARYLDMHSGAMFVKNDKNQLELMGAYAWSNNERPTCYEMGEGLVGQVALEQKVLEITDVPKGYLAVGSGMGSASPSHLIIFPVIYENELKGVLEFARLGPLSSERGSFLQHSVKSIAIAIKSAQYRTRVSQLLETTTHQSEALKEQQEELRSVNDELEKRAGILEESEEELKAQSEELQKSNVELEELSEQLMRQKEEIERKNKDIELSNTKISEKAEELARASKYKSEFLANMSHELRTPLNSLLLLSQMLAANDEGNLTDDQVESAQVIFNGGKELLELINDILDLSKVEAGKMSVNLDDTLLDDIKIGLETLFKPVAQSNGLGFSVHIASGTHKSIFTDSQRLMQIIKNFLSNAFKFTEQGSVQVRMFNEDRPGKFAQNSWVAFAVKDSGIGIPKEKQASIFESFQQADGSTSRKYGGTGLGLAISREMTELLGGFIEIASEEGKGTTFTLFLPVNPVCSLGSEKVLADNYVADVFAQAKGDDDSDAVVAPVEKTEAPEMIVEPQASEEPETIDADYQLLIIEDDKRFVNVFSQVANKHNFACLKASTGKQGLSLAQKYQPSAIVLDLGLPDMDGQEVLTRLKEHQSTRNIPVHIVSARDPNRISSLGSVGYLTKPLSMSDIDNLFLKLESSIAADIHDVLIFDPNQSEREEVGKVLEAKGLHVGYAASADEAATSLEDFPWQCLILDLELGDTSAVDFLDEMNSKLGEKMPSVIVHASGLPEQSEHARLQEFTQAMVMKGDRAMERITDEMSLFLHNVNKNQPQDQADDEVLSGAEKSLEGHKILLVDDDVRNTFALSKALQGLGMEVVLADNGQNALHKLEEEDGLELVLMDIMMPVMDGYEATAKIRQMEGVKDLPIIALTAKAMAGDKAKCLAAGANDYMTKPLDMAKLTEMLKVWLLQ